MFSERRLSVKDIGIHAYRYGGGWSMYNTRACLSPENVKWDV
jgi:hypothetical protein